MTFYAHTSGTDETEWQTVFTHLTNTALWARTIGADTGLAEFAAVAAMLHDVGKYSIPFQMRLRGGPKVDHATAGAKEANRLFRERGQAHYGRLLAYCIAGHHGGLPDGGSPTDTAEELTLEGRLKREVPDYSAFFTEFDTARLTLPDRMKNGFQPVDRFRPGFSVAFAARMIYSILVDADFMETETSFLGTKKPRGEYTSLSALAEQYFTFLQKFDNPTDAINRQRSSTLKSCLQKAKMPPGLFTLSLPTGAGKTFASMAFAMRHAQLHNLKRIIYVIPYTSIIEQNAAVFRSSLKPYEEQILEHHSNFDWKESDQEAEANPTAGGTSFNKLRLAAENWDIPIVVTTNVQFFESLYANRSSRSRKLHNLAKSVIIFDEAQMLPLEFLRPCLYSVAELVQNYGASAIFCTATQPALDRFLPPDSTIHELIDDVRAQFTFYRRVQVQKLGKQTDAEMIARLASHPQALCIVNTRKHAQALFSGLPEGSFHLSTLMCPAHRSSVISEIRLRLREGIPCRVVSTQLLEAGVDLDFPVGYRALAGLESINQAAGRVNREQRLPIASLFVFEPDSQTARMPKSIQQRASVAKLILDDYDDPISETAIRAYYEKLYLLQDTSMFDRAGILDHFQLGNSTLRFNFQTAAQDFRLIDQDTMPVIIPFDAEAVALLDQLRAASAPLPLLRKLQKYTVNIYQPEFDALYQLGAFELVLNAYAVLNEHGVYHPQTGLGLPEKAGGQAIYCE